MKTLIKKLDNLTFWIVCESAAIAMLAINIMRGDWTAIGVSVVAVATLAHVVAKEVQREKRL